MRRRRQEEKERIRYIRRIKRKPFHTNQLLTKKEVGEKVDAMRGIPFKSTQDTLKMFPTQCPKLNQNYREELKEKYRFLENIVFRIWMDSKCTFINMCDELKTVKKQLTFIFEETDLLCDLLDRNIFDTRKNWGFHFEETKASLEKRIVECFKLMKDTPSWTEEEK